MSGTPRWLLGIAVLPAGRTSWKLGREKTWLNPPPPAIHPISRTPGFVWHVDGGFTLSTDVPVTASVHRYVPPTPVTSGSDAGQYTPGPGSRVGLFGGDFRNSAVPSSPEEPSTVTPAACASLNAKRRLSRDCVLPKARSPEAKLCEITPARWCFTT